MPLTQTERISRVTRTELGHLIIRADGFPLDFSPHTPFFKDRTKAEGYVADRRASGETIDYYVLEVVRHAAC